MPFQENDGVQPKAYIEIEGLKLYRNIGVEEQENVVGNLFEVYLRFEYDCEHAMVTDRPDLAINYAHVVELIKEELDFPTKLLENAVYHVFRALVRRYPQISAGKITLSKLTPPISAEVDRVSFSYEW